MTKNKCSCRYGCGKTFEYTHLRGRHEAMKHGGVWKNGAAPIADVLPAPVAATSPADHIQRALTELESRESTIALDMERLDALHREMSQVLNAKAILQDALAKLKPELQMEIAKP